MDTALIDFWQDDTGIILLQIKETKLHITLIDS